MKKYVLSILFVILTGTMARAQVCVIANKSVPLDTLKKSELLDYYTGDIKKWNNKKPVVLLDLKSKSKVKKVFYKFLGKSPSRMKSIWLKKLLSGEGDPPESFSSEDDLLEKVAATPGAIGFISKEKVTNDVKTLLVIGE